MVRPTPSSCGRKPTISQTLSTDTLIRPPVSDDIAFEKAISNTTAAANEGDTGTRQVSASYKRNKIPVTKQRNNFQKGRLKKKKSRSNVSGVMGSSCVKVPIGLRRENGIADIEMSSIQHKDEKKEMSYCIIDFPKVFKGRAKGIVFFYTIGHIIPCECIAILITFTKIWIFYSRIVVKAKRSKPSCVVEQVWSAYLFKKLACERNNAVVILLSSTENHLSPAAEKDGKREGFRENTSLIFGILKSLQCGDFSSLSCCGREWQSTRTFKYSEKPQSNVSSPRPQDYRSEIAREDSFRHLRNLPIRARVLAECGFFWNGYQLQCFLCNTTHTINDVTQEPYSRIWHSPSCSNAICSESTLGNSTRHRLQEVVADGRVSDDVRDPPGQQSVYIAPGDVRLESYRLSTFNNFPSASPTDRKALASAGFYFTGYFDRVKCFACGRTVENWEATDNPGDIKWHKESCPYPRGGDTGNVPISNLFSRFRGSASGFSSRNQRQEVLEQRDPATGTLIRTVRYPSDLPERVRQSGGSFEIGPNNTVNIQSGPIGGSNRTPGLAESRRQPNARNASTHQPPLQWRMANVISADHRRFVSNLYLNRELDRLVSFARWPTGRPNVSPTDLARNGFFYLGDMDRTQCFSCAGVLRNWTVNDSARVEHRTHFPNCRFVLGTETRNVPVPLQPESPDIRQRNFPCRYPSNPHMRSEASRLGTFDNRWPVGRMAATPAEIAQAGFFFLGERDRVKCWYCNGGLQHWEYDDAPWIEHAKWFPNCQFLLSVKGEHFVYRHLTLAAHLSRPIIARQQGSPIDPPNEGEGSAPPEDIPPSTPNARAPTPPPTIVDPQEEMRKRQERVAKAIRESDVVKNVLAMGFSENIVRVLLQEKVDSGTEENPVGIYETVSGLLEDVMKREEEIREEEERSNQASAMQDPSINMMPTMSSVYSSMTTDPNLSSLGPSPGSGKYNVSYMDEDDDRDMYGVAEPNSGQSSLNSVTQAKQHVAGEVGASLQEALNKIEEERMCKICFSNQADMVFVPCGHMCCCRNCTEAIRHCPVCRVRIEKAIKTYST